MEDWDDRQDWPDRDRYVLGRHGTGGRDDAADGGHEDSGRDTDSGRDADGQDNGGHRSDGQDDCGRDGGSGGTRPPGGPGRPRRPGGGGKNRRGRSRKRIAAQINLTLPLTTLLVLGDAPGDAGPFGPLDPAAARALARTAAAHPQTRWCVTVTDQAVLPWQTCRA